MATAAVVALGGCSGAGTEGSVGADRADGAGAPDGPGARVGASPQPSSGQALTYEATNLTMQQADALRDHAHGLMADGRVPEDVGMVAAPQPPGLPRNVVVVAVGWGSCGGTEPLGEVRLEVGELVVEVLDHRMAPGEVCAGMAMSRGIRVELPDGVSAKEVRSVTVRHRAAGH